MKNVYIVSAVSFFLYVCAYLSFVVVVVFTPEVYTYHHIII